MKKIKSPYYRSLAYYQIFLVVAFCYCSTSVLAHSLDSLKIIIDRETKDKSMLSLIKHAANYSHKDLNLSLAYLSLAHENALKTENYKDLFDIQRETGFVYEENNQLENSLANFHEALKTAERLNNQILKITIYTDIAILNEKLGEYAIAKNYHVK